MSRPLDSGDPLDALSYAIEVLVLDPDPRAQIAAAAIGAVIVGEAVDLFAYIANADNLPGPSLREKATLAKRDRLLRQIGAGLTARELADDLDRYYCGAWLRRDRALTRCPYGHSDRHGIYFQIFKLRARPLSERQIRDILRGGQP